MKNDVIRKQDRVEGCDQILLKCPKCGMLNLFNLPTEFKGMLKNLKKYKGVPCAECGQNSRANEWHHLPLNDKDRERIAEGMN